MNQELKGNEKIEEAILMIQQEPSMDTLSFAILSINRRMREGGKLILSVESAAPAEGQLPIRVLEIDGEEWWVAFTSFEEQSKGSDAIQSTFLVDMDQLFHAAMSEKRVGGIVLNPWNRTLQLDRKLIAMVIGLQDHPTED